MTQIGLVLGGGGARGYAHIGALKALEERGHKLEKALAKYLAPTFDDLRIPLKLTACDIQQGVLVVFDRGDLRAAVRATISLPGVFPPARVEDRILLDGGLINNLPVDIIRTMTHEPVIAVDVAAPANRVQDFDAWQQPFEAGYEAMHVALEEHTELFDEPAAAPDQKDQKS